MVGEIIPEWWATSSGISSGGDRFWRKAALEPGVAGRLTRREILIKFGDCRRKVHNGGHKTKAGPFANPYFIGFLGYPEPADESPSLSAKSAAQVIAEPAVPLQERFWQ
jgi:hypothetical protein